MMPRGALSPVLALAMACGTAASAVPSMASDAPPLVGKTATRPAAPARSTLDLKIGRVEQYMTPAEKRAILAKAQAEEDTVLVEGAREPPPPNPEKRPIPVGIAAPFWALRHPTKAWRLLVPDPNAPPPGKPSPIPPRQWP